MKMSFNLCTHTHTLGLYKSNLLVKIFCTRLQHDNYLLKLITLLGIYHGWNQAHQAHHSCVAVQAEDLILGSADDKLSYAFGHIWAGKEIWSQWTSLWDLSVGQSFPCRSRFPFLGCFGDWRRKMFGRWKSDQLRWDCSFWRQGCWKC